MEVTPDRDNEAFLSKVLEIFSKTLRQSGPHITASYTLVGSILLMGALGWILDNWLDTSPWLFLGGILLGLAVGFYEIAKVVFKQ
ncbi:MAG: AtpZ/AtpI family protein [Candidatus Neomarinimicrobiota bacterium]